MLTGFSIRLSGHKICFSLVDIATIATEIVEESYTRIKQLANLTTGGLGSVFKPVELDGNVKSWMQLAKSIPNLSPLQEDKLSELREIIKKAMQEYRRKNRGAIVEVPSDKFNLFEMMKAAKDIGFNEAELKSAVDAYANVYIKVSGLLISYIAPGNRYAYHHGAKPRFENLHLDKTTDRYISFIKEALANPSVSSFFNLLMQKGGVAYVVLFTLYSLLYTLISSYKHSSTTELPYGASYPEFYQAIKDYNPKDIAIKMRAILQSRKVKDIPQILPC